MDQFQIWRQFWNPWEKIFDCYFIVCTRMVAIWHKNERLKKMVLEEVITQSPVDQFQIQGQFWNPWEKNFDWYFMIHTRMVVIWHKNECLKKMVLEEPQLGPQWTNFKSEGSFGILGKKSVIDILWYVLVWWRFDIKMSDWKKWCWKSHNSVPSGPVSNPRAV